MSIRENTFLWIIWAAPLGLFLGFMSAPSGVISQFFCAFVGTAIFTVGACMASWAVKKFCSSSKE